MKEKLYFFVTHKVMAVVISILTILVGVIALTTLPVEQYPDIAPPTIYVTTSYTGADATSVLKSVVMPLEESINGVEHMTYITSETTSTGDVTIQVYFEQGTNADMATVNVQNRVQKVMGLLPTEVTKVGVQVYKRQNSTLQFGSIVSRDGRFDQEFLANYLDINVIPKIKRINGVGSVSNLGNTYSLRIWLKPDAMAQYNLLPSDVFNAISTQSLVSPAGSLGENSENTFLYTMEYRGRLTEISEFNDIVIRAQEDGTLLKLSDVAEVKLGAISYTFSSEVDKEPGVVFMISQVSGANATEVNAQIGQLYEDMKSELPPGVEFQIMQTADDFLFAAMHNVVETLIIAILLVILVVFFFLQDFKATLIPSISIIVSMIGTFAVVKVAGFSLNILTLFALVLAIGTVVDDSIVVVEAVMAKLENGYKSSRLATSDALHEVFSAVISCTLVFMAVFLPVTFMPGTSGVFFTQFGITIATSVGLSCINALTLCPALAAVLMRPKQEGEAKHKGITYYTKLAYNVSYSALADKYLGSIQKYMKKPAISWFLLAAALVVMVWVMRTTPTELVPQEDQGVMLVDVKAPAGYTLKQTEEVEGRIVDIVQQYEEVESVARISGFGILGGTNYNNGLLLVRLKTWDDRKGMSHSINMVMYRLMLDCECIKEAQVIPLQMPQIPGYGQGNAMELKVLDRQGIEVADFAKKVQPFIQAIQQRKEVGAVFCDYDDSYPKYKVDIDATICARAGVSPAEVLQTLGTYCGGSYVSDYNQFGKSYRVMVQALPEYRLDPAALDNIFVRVANGKMTPISQFVTLTPSKGSSVERRFNLYSTITLNINAAGGYSSGQVMKAIEDVYNEQKMFAQGVGYEYGGMSREEAANAKSNMTVLIYAICILLIYLILACLYNSWFIPLAVLMSVPFGLMGAFACTKLVAPLGFTNNIYLQTGVIMLIGLLSKTAILITEFAVQKRKEGLSIYEAAFGACQDRFRPILMTVATMIIGMIPLIIESGAGCVGNRSLAIGVTGGMAVGTIALLFVVPVFYMAFQTLHEKFQGEELE
ncbi:MAG: efflux RND transporter permease subunit [Paludibacteraceae bacterium]|nr:efflux RND transporter permease subunit [Paludibacteraceae bacterium]